MTTRPTVVCSGWWTDETHTARVHDDVIVLVEGDATRPVSHGICWACRVTFEASLPRRIAAAREAYRQATKQP